MRLVWEFMRRPQSFMLAWRGLQNWGASQDPLEFCSLIELVKKSGRHPAMMEIGMRRGGTLYAWCQLANPDATIISVDYHPKVDDAAVIKRLNGLTRDSQRLHCIRKNSHLPETLQAVTEALGDQELTFLFIDGDHSYEGIKQDFEMYAPLVKDGGLIAFHDILESPANPEFGVPQFWNEIKTGYQHYESFWKQSSHARGRRRGPREKVRL